MTWEERPATPERVRQLSTQPGVSPAALGRALELTLGLPDRLAWQRFLEVVLTGLGVVLVAAGVIFFIAFNWSSLGRFAKFALLELGIVAGFLVAWRTGLEGPAGRWGLTLAALLIGPLLAFYGQTYQLKADSWRLFGGWAALMLPWTLAARHSFLWLAFWVVANTGVVLALDAYFVDKPELLGLINLIWWGLAESRYRTWESGRWTLYAGATVTLGAWTLAACGALSGPEFAVSELLVLGAALATLGYYRQCRRDGFLLALACGSLIACLTTLIGQALLDSDDFWGFLLTATLLVGQVSAATWWLRRQVTQ